MSETSCNVGIDRSLYDKLDKYGRLPGKEKMTIPDIIVEILNYCLDEREAQKNPGGKQ